MPNTSVVFAALVSLGVFVCSYAANLYNRGVTTGSQYVAAVAVAFGAFALALGACVKVLKSYGLLDDEDEDDEDEDDEDDDESDRAPDSPRVVKLKKVARGVGTLTMLAAGETVVCLIWRQPWYAALSLVGMLACALTLMWILNRAARVRQQDLLRAADEAIERMVKEFATPRQCTYEEWERAVKQRSEREKKAGR